MTRFLAQHNTVVDQSTGLEWFRDASRLEFPMTWSEAFASLEAINARALFGHADWRVPNRRELFSLISLEAINPSLPAGHPFLRVVTSYYWTSTTCSRLPDQAWYIHLGGARVFKGLKNDSYLLWPVRSAQPGRSAIMQTGQCSCFTQSGEPIPCQGTGQDGAYRSGRPWPEPRFQEQDGLVLDRLTGLTWTQEGHRPRTMVSWEEAFQFIHELNAHRVKGLNTWRLPSIVELESLVDMEHHAPALPKGHPFDHVQDHYWSCTSSRYDLNYAWGLYLKDGALGVGFKPLQAFSVWAVSSSTLPTDGRVDAGSEGNRRSRTVKAQSNPHRESAAQCHCL